ncbi:MAG: hypothetical protein KDD53_10305, partial [Bdellovibrionales bacterium]|nr:hypothetical protein [Bdellovibrionales bacterium]
SPVNETGGYLWACNFCIQAELFKSLGGFDETFPHPAMEDVDLCYRLKQKGIYPQFIWKAAVCHPWRPIGNIRTLLNQQSAALIYLRLHPEERARMTPGFYFRHALRNFVNNTLRDSLRLRFRGIHKALLEHCIHIFTGLRIMISNFESKSSK